MGYIELDDMEYSADGTVAPHGGFNEHYTGTLENGDILQLSHYGYYEGYEWEWKVYLPDEYPIQGYQSNYRSHTYPSAEEALEDFNECYEPRNWKSHSEWKAENGPVYVRCAECGWEGDSDDLDGETVYEDWGDVYYSKCPSCGEIEYEGRELFEEI